MRKCSKCKVVKNLETAFYKNKNKKDGRQHYCKECQKDIAMERNGGRKLDKLNHTDTHRQCRSCKEMVPFEKMPRRHSDKKFDSYCTPCVSEKMRVNNLESKYGITIKEYNTLLDAQDGVCAICFGVEKNKKLSVDHNHDTGEVRGLLCHKCNSGIGLLGDKVDALQRAIDYLKIGVASDAPCR